MGILNTIFKNKTVKFPFLKLNGIMFKASVHIRAKTVTDKEVIKQIKELTTWDVEHHIQIIMTHSVTYKGFNICVCLWNNMMHI